MNKDIIKDSIKCLSNAKLNDTTYEIARDIVIEQLNKQKEVLDKIKEIIKASDDCLINYDEMDKKIHKLLEEIE